MVPFIAHQNTRNTRGVFAAASASTGGEGGLGVPADAAVQSLSDSFQRPYAHQSFRYG